MAIIINPLNKGKSCNINSYYVLLMGSHAMVSIYMGNFLIFSGYVDAHLLTLNRYLAPTTASPNTKTLAKLWGWRQTVPYCRAIRKQKSCQVRLNPSYM